jgi:hypothetical protein
MNSAHEKLEVWDRSVDFAVAVYMKIDNSLTMSIGCCATFFLSFPSSGLGTGSPKLELLHTCVPKLELGNKKKKNRKQPLSLYFVFLLFRAPYIPLTYPLRRLIVQIR